MSRDRDGNLNRRRFLTTSSALGLTSALGGCIFSSMQNDSESVSTESEFRDIGNEWVTFGDANDWGMRYNPASNEFEVVHKPFEQNSRSNIRIEADTSEDKGDVYIDDSLIVENETEVSDGSASDPSYTFANQNNTGIWRSEEGLIGITIRGSPAVTFETGATRVAGDIITTGSVETTIWDSNSDHTPNLPAVSVTRSGDGSTTTFRLDHPLDRAPSVASVTATSADAAGQFWVSDKSQDALEVTYNSPPSAGEQNLSFDIVVSL